MPMRRIRKPIFGGISSGGDPNHFVLNSWRPLFYDEDVIDLCHRIGALYRIGEDTKQRKRCTVMLVLPRP